MEDSTPQFAPHPTAEELQEELTRTREYLRSCYGTEEERRKVALKIQDLKSRLDMLTLYQAQKDTLL